MIETTHIQLSRAAEMLGTNDDALLIAAVELRIRLYWLLNQTINAEFHVLGEQTQARASKHFMFVPMSASSAAGILQGRSIEITSLSEIDHIGGYWETDSYELMSDEFARITPDKSLVYLKRKDVNDILQQGVPNVDSVKESESSTSRKPTPRDSSLVTTVAALLAQWPGGAIPSSKDLENAAQSIGLSISDDTIRKVLSMAREYAPTLPPPK